MKKLTVLALAVKILLSFVGVCSAGTIYLNPGPGTPIQTAINNSNNGDVIIVQPGLYVENINMAGPAGVPKAIPLQSTDPGDPAIVTTTIIDGGGAGSVITCNSGEGPKTIISGFVITNGNANGGGDYGGGMYNQLSSPTVSNCTFSSNTANDGGGGMGNVAFSSPMVSDCTFIGNTVSGYGSGGGMYNEYSSPTVSGCTFIGNTSTLQGGGMGNGDITSPTVTDSYFCNNEPDALYGGPPHPDSSGNNMEFCPPPRPIVTRIAGDIDASGKVDLVDFAIIADRMQALILLAENWLAGCL